MCRIHFDYFRNDYLFIFSWYGWSIAMKWSIRINIVFGCFGGGCVNHEPINQTKKLICFTLCVHIAAYMYICWSRAYEQWRPKKWCKRFIWIIGLSNIILIESHSFVCMCECSKCYSARRFSFGCLLIKTVFKWW